jgi:hypothetical protein
MGENAKFIRGKKLYLRHGRLLGIVVGINYLKKHQHLLLSILQYI